MIKQILGRLPRKPSSKSSSAADAASNNSSTRAAAAANKSKAAKKLSPTLNSNGNCNAALSYEYDALPSFRDVPSADKPTLFLRKLAMCSIIFDFTDPTSSLREKDVKRQTLLELVDYVGTVSAKFSDAAMQEATRMVAANLFRTFPSSNSESRLPDSADAAEEEEPAMEPAWPHLQIVYEFFLRFIASPETDAKLAKRYVDHSFVLKLLDLFESEDQREREYLKTILHRVYGKFMVHRPFIRKAINNIFYRFVFESPEKHNGISELLEILGSVINGFALPLKEEHKLFLVRALVPLHKPKCVAMYHQQLSYCITQFVEKDYKLADTVIRRLLKYWPLTNSSKEVMFIGELEEVLEATQEAEFQRCMVPLFRQIGRCLSSSHFQVAERALFLWNNDHVGNLITVNRRAILPIIFPALERNARGHWNQAVQSLTLNVRKLFLDADQELFEECLLRFQEEEAKEREVRERREMTWKRLEEVAASKAITNEAVLVAQRVSSLRMNNTSPRTLARAAAGT